MLIPRIASPVMFSFGTSAAAASTASSSTPAAPAATAPASGGFSFGGFKPNAPAASSTATSSTTAAPSAFSSFKLSTPAASTSAATTTTAPAAATTSTPAPTLSFGAPSTSTTAAAKPLFGAPAPAATSNTTTNAALPATNTTSAATAAGITPVQPAPVTAPAPSLLRGKSLADIVHRLETDLSASIQSFSAQANEIAAWDEQLLHVGDELREVLLALERAEEGQSQVDGALNYVEGQQVELESILSQFENVVGGWEREVGLGSGGSAALASAVAGGAGANLRASLGAGGSALGPYRGAGLENNAAELERENAYALAESLNSQLDDMSSALKTMIEDVNALSNPSAGPSASKANGSSALSQNASAGSNTEDAVQQIVSILNSHLGSLRWVDDNVRDLSEQVQALKLNAGAGNGDAGAARTTLGSSRNGAVRRTSVGLRASLGPNAGPAASPGYGAGGFYREGSVASSRRRF
ncbi:FG-nucleoporin nsp1 [Tilletia horrida]|uniref:FG-nucleoporin nsp1 n=1 Tax=Tilletia horrida TaxID=155126 RepID=A0AAN6JQ72_9BASI|nr:FG-nucleoporin nsp1 [Tilletia horrida]